MIIRKLRVRLKLQIYYAPLPPPPPRIRFLKILKSCLFLFFKMSRPPPLKNDAMCLIRPIYKFQICCCYKILGNTMRTMVPYQFELTRITQALFVIYIQTWHCHPRGHVMFVIQHLFQSVSFKFLNILLTQSNKAAQSDL